MGGTNRKYGKATWEWMSEEADRRSIDHRKHDESRQ